MHPPELDPAVIEQKRQVMVRAAAEEAAARAAAEEADRAHQAALQAAADAALLAEKEEQEAIAAAAAAGREEAEAEAAEAAAAIEEQEAVAAEAAAAKELQDVVEAERILAAAKEGGDAEQIAQAEADLVREQEEAVQANQAAERERAEADEAMQNAERERAEAEEANKVAATELEEATQAKLNADELRAQEARAKALADDEQAVARDKAAALDEVTQALTVDVDGIAAGELDWPTVAPKRVTAEDMAERFGWGSLHDAIANSASWELLREILEADPAACADTLPSGGSGAKGMLPLHALLAIHVPQLTPAVGMRLQAKKRPLGHRNMSGDKYYPCDVLAVSPDGKMLTVSYPDEGRRGIQDDALPVELLAPCVTPKGGSAALVPVDLVQRMIAAHPTACQTKDSLGFLPVQYAMKNGASIDVVRALRFTGSPTMVYRHKEKVNRALGKIRTLRQTNLLTPSLSNLGKALQMEKEAEGSNRRLSAAEKVARTSAHALLQAVDEMPENVMGDVLGEDRQTEEYKTEVAA